jgi:leucyl/phenylalanyl-tRNA--protein transferase
MFHRRRDASKVALVALVEILRSYPGKRLIDAQWCTEHLASLGAIEITRAEYLAILATVVNEEPCLGGGATADRF